MPHWALCLDFFLVLESVCTCAVCICPETSCHGGAAKLLQAYANSEGSGQPVRIPTI